MGVLEEQPVWSGREEERVGKRTRNVGSWRVLERPLCCAGSGLRGRGDRQGREGLHVIQTKCDDGTDRGWDVLESEKSEEIQGACASG